MIIWGKVVLMTPGALPPRSPAEWSERHIWRCAVCLAVFMAIFIGPVWPADAQRYDGRNSTPNVIVDYIVLDELGQAPNVPRLFLQNPTGSAYHNNPYRTQPRFPVIKQPRNRVRPNRFALTPPNATKRRTVRGPSRKNVKRTSPDPQIRVVRREPTETPRVTTPPVANPPPTPTIKKAPAAIKPPPKIAAVKPRKLEKPPAVEAMSIPPKVVEPPPLPPVTSAPKPKQITRSALPPPPALPESEARDRSQNLKVAASPPIAAKPASVKQTKRTAPPKPKQLASLPGSTGSVRSGSLRRILFPRGSAKLSDKASTGLKNVADALSKDSGLRIQLLAYAGRLSDSSSQARRLSLSRALAARSKLIDQGVRSTRIDVRALGNKSAGGPADRIDIIVTKR